MLVFAAMVPVPLMVPPAIVLAAASVSCVVPAPSSFTVLAPIASALVTVRVPAVFSSSVPIVPEKVADVAALAASSNNLSLAPLPMVSARVPVLVMAPVISSVPPFAVTKAAPLAVSVEANTPCPLIVPLEIVAPDASVKVAPVPASVTLPAPSTACVPTVNAAVLPLSSSVPPLSVSVCAWLPAASSLSVSVLAVSDSVSRLPLSVMADCISSVPPLAVTKAAPLAVSVDANTPCPLIVPVVMLAPDASVKVAPIPANVTLPVPSTACVPTVSAAVLPLSSSVPPVSVSASTLLVPRVKLTTSVPLRSVTVLPAAPVTASVAAPEIVIA